MVDLSTEFAGIKLKNPVITASGTFGYGEEFRDLIDLNRLGGLVVKGLSVNPMQGAVPPRLHETASGMLNAIGLQNVGVERFVAEKLPLLRRYDTAIFANVFGHTTDDYVRVVEVLNGAEGLIRTGRIGTIFMELNWTNEASAVCPASESVRLLGQAGYRFSRPGKCLHWEKAGDWLHALNDVVARTA